MTAQDLETFFSVAERVLLELDPALDLPEDERWAAAVRNKVRSHSPALRQGIRESLVLLSIYGATRLRNAGGIDLQHRVSSLIRRLLRPLTLDKLLSHLDDLPDYAEAAPDIFLELIEADLREAEPVVFGLLKPAENSPFDRCLRSNLLWALEGLGWTHLGRVSTILARLSSIPIHDNYANTPIGSLENLYRFGLPRTAVSLGEWIQSLQILTERFPDVGWRVCLAQLSTGPQFSIPSHRPRWRDDSSLAGQGVTPEEVHAFRLKAFELVLAWPNHDQGTLGDLVKLLHDLPDEDQLKVWDLIDAWANSEAEDEAKASLRERIRWFAFTWRGHLRGVRGEALGRACAAFDRLEPHDPVVRHSWLFVKSWIEPSADEEEEGEIDYDKHGERVRGFRTAAMKEIWEKCGFDGVSALLGNYDTPTHVGEALEPCIHDCKARVDFLRQCLSVSGGLEDKIERCLREFLWSVDDDARRALLVAAAEGADAVWIVRLYRSAPFRPHTWRLLDRYDKNIRDRYWREVMPEAWNRYTDAELTELITRLLAVKRPRAAFSVVQIDWSRIGTPQLKRLLLDIGTLNAEPTDHYLPESDGISEALSELDGRSGVAREEMVRLELMYMQILDHSKHGVPNLERWVSESPIGFVQILSLLFKRADEREDPPEWNRGDAANGAALASSAYWLLRRISRIPGTGDSGEIDEVELSRWIAETRRLCAKHGAPKPVTNISDRF